MSSRDSSGCVLSDVWSAGSVGHLVGAAVAGACAGGRELDVYDSFRTPENTCHQGLVAITYYMRLKKKKWGDKRSLQPTNPTSARWGQRPPMHRSTGIIRRRRRPSIVRSINWRRGSITCCAATIRAQVTIVKYMGLVCLLYTSPSPRD